jgi:hypothetical protein
MAHHTHTPTHIHTHTQTIPHTHIHTHVTHRSTLQNNELLGAKPETHAYNPEALIDDEHLEIDEQVLAKQRR